ncbi:PAN2-PAN3 deadenylation complex catalytic subunit PAN2 [Exaiptasia diaphana]|uniref:USP domain-containing protein n=1 Tax=Exaiptasia diaphana TaxID=2652724 RepID=A0A913Y2Y6_EXADI|nr:PAN2-PAN3 deadenylation complex catalytic subunit PAN2 [Exaiptasia diaphana]
MELDHGGLVKEEYQEIRAIFNNGRDPCALTNVVVDPFEELVWVGNQSGHITSYYGLQLQRYTAFQAHHSEIRHMLADDRGILSLSCNQLRYGKRTGIQIFSLSQPSMSNLQCMLQRDNSNLLLAGHQDHMVEVDLKTGSVTGEVEVDPGTNAHGGMCTALDVSSNCHTMAFGDSSGYLHLWGDTKVADLCYNNFSIPTEFATEVPRTQHLSIDDYSVPLSSFPLPYSNEPLFSNWPSNNYIREDRNPIAIDPEILRTMVVRHFIGYAPNPGNKRRNQWPYQNKPGHYSAQNRKKDESDVPESPMSRDDDPSILIPKAYRRVEMKYSKLGLEDFDFGHYNKTKFAGLEIHIPNAYCNAMLQVLYFLEPLRVSLQNHICKREFCLACELGFLFYMLDQSTGAPCQASNFLRAFRTIPQASALGLVMNDIDESAGNANFPRLIQSWIRFVLQQSHQDTLEPKVVPEGKPEEHPEQAPEKAENTSVVERLFGADVEQWNKCRCGKDTTRKSSSLIYDLEYPQMLGKPENTAVSFESLIESTLCREQSMQAWCDKCGRYQPTVQTRKVTSLPDVLAFNCHVDHPNESDLWKTQQKLLSVPHHEEKPVQTTKPCRYGENCTRAGCKFRHDVVIVETDEDPKSWIPFVIKIASSDNGQLLVSKVEEGENCKKVKCGENEVIYDLHATVGFIQDPKAGGNLVAHVHVGTTYHSRKEGVTCDQWYLFNDFAITPISPIEAAVFNLDWKLPCSIMYIRRDLNSRHDLKIRQTIDDSILFKDHSVSEKQGRSKAFTRLTPDELPGEGALVALDAEFVTLNQEEAEIRSDGTRSTIKPSQMSAARITVIRGETGPLEGVPFIDDYISTSEQVVDYLTKFSGIKPGDLDATMSSKHLTTLKTTYLKIRALADRKVKFIGHGLKKDFRVINLMVPKAQVFDTVELFHLPRQRYLSLRFLAWYFLGLNIQSETHDSIEDALTALKLYRKYVELTADKEPAEFKKVLKQLYEDGRKCNWKVGGNNED